MPTLDSALIRLDLGLQGATTAVKEVAVVRPGTIKAAWVGALVAATTATLAIAKGSTNILSAATVDMSGALTTAAKQTLATAATTLRVAAGDIIKATWTITTAGSFVGGTCVVEYEPDTW